MFKSGQSGNPNGRPKGGENKVTTEIRQAYADLIHGNLDNITLWLQEVAERDPQKAIDLLIKLSPFVLPKKTELHASEDWKPFNLVLPANPNEAKDPPTQG
jgi:hypothetical protein